MFAATQPVHAPVTGRGIPIKIIKPTTFSLFIMPPFLSDLAKSQLKNFLDISNFLKYLEIGSNKYIIGIVIKKLAIIDTITTLYQGRPKTKIPYGIEPLDSITGIIDINIIIIYGLLIYNESISTVLSSNYFPYN